MKLARLNDGPEIFHTLQGEGKSMGMPSVFVRLSLCNLHCTWCDTDYTWNWKGTRFRHVRDAEPGYSKFDQKEMILDWPAQKTADKILGFNCPNIVITGGEPLMQQRALEELLTLLRSVQPGLHIEIETNGTLQPSSILAELIDQYNVSPKLENSGNKTSLRDKPAVMSFFSKDPKSNFKFVVDTPEDLQEILGLVKKYSILPRQVYLMPQGTQRESLVDKRSWLTDICRENNFNFTDRMHIHLFGNKRGV